MSFCPDLQEIIDGWDDLPEHLRTAVLAVARSHTATVVQPGTVIRSPAGT